MDTTIALVNALVISRIDYCNAVLSGVNGVHLRRLQGIFRASARMIFQRRKYDHVTDLLHDTLQWLPIRQTVDYKLFTIVYQCLHGMAQSCLVEWRCASQFPMSLVVAAYVP